MKKSCTIAIFGSYGGHNAGDDAILCPIIRDILKTIPEAEFLLLTRTPSFYKRLLNNDRIRMVPLSPLSKNEVPKQFHKMKALRIFMQMKYIGLGFYGWQAINSILNSDVILMIQNTFFDHKLSSPLFNVLPAWSVEIPFAKILKKKVVAYNTGLGPIKTEQGRKMLRRILNSCDFVSLRQHEGLDFIRKNHIDVPVYLGADPALNNNPLPKEEAMELLEKEGIDFSKPLLGVNINVYIDQWMIDGKKGLTKKEFILLISNAVKEIINQEVIQPVIVCTNHMDFEISEELKETINPNIAMLDNYKYDHHQLMGMIGCMDLLLGTRMHACVLAAAMSVPVVSINYAPKVKDFMYLIGLRDYTNEVNNLSELSLRNSLASAWIDRKALKREIEKKLPRLKKKASYPAIILKKLLRGESINQEEWSS